MGASLFSSVYKTNTHTPIKSWFRIDYWIFPLGTSNRNVKATEQGYQYCSKCQKETWHTPKFGLVFENKRKCSVCTTINQIEE